MLEIIALVFLTRRIGAKAVAKGLSKGTWQLYTVGGWLLFEFTGAIIGYMISQNIILAALLGLGAAFGGFLLVKSRIDKYPDIDDKDGWLQRIGQQDEQR